MYPQLLDYRRTVSDMYAAVRNSNLSPRETWMQWRKTRDILFGNHTQTALTTEQLAHFKGLNYFDYNPDWRFEVAIVTAVTQEVLPFATAVDGIIHMQKFGRVHLQQNNMQFSLSLFWILGYGGGVFLPFRDASNKNNTYGGGRYLLDSIKHADFGQTPDGKLILDFNYAYNPSCAYNPHWSCPLAPQENWLDISIPVGEKRFLDLTTNYHFVERF